MRAERADFASHPPPRHLRTASISSKPTSISPFVAFYQIASSLRKWKSGFRSCRDFGYGETRHRLNEMTDLSFRPTLSTCEPLSTRLHLHFSAFPSHEFP